ncbi:tetratricopeptide repeat protein [Ectothiorhodospiraceae bacterium 2226]|nr:tetratricopeptide repeat protein [Ectothiorhodospiraceae bacterium 2226]
MASTFGAQRGLSVDVPLAWHHWAHAAIAACLLGGSVLLAGCAAGGPAQPAASRAAGDAPIDPAAQAEFVVAVQLLEAERYTQGIARLESVAERAPSAAAPHVNLAMAYLRLDKHQAAEESFQKALALEPEHPVANNEYGVLLRKQGRFDEARRHYQTALAAYPDFHPARRNLGILCDLYLNDARCALEHYQAYAKAVPGDETVKLWVVDLKRRVGE